MFVKVLMLFASCCCMMLLMGTGCTNVPGSVSPNNKFPSSEIFSCVDSVYNGLSGLSSGCVKEKEEVKEIPEIGEAALALPSSASGEKANQKQYDDWSGGEEEDERSSVLAEDRDERNYRGSKRDAAFKGSPLKERGANLLHDLREKREQQRDRRKEKNEQKRKEKIKKQFDKSNQKANMVHDLEERKKRSVSKMVEKDRWSI